MDSSDARPSETDFKSTNVIELPALSDLGRNRLVHSFTLFSC